MPLHISVQAQTNKFLCELAEDNQRLTRSWQPVHSRFISGLSARRKALFVPGCWPGYRHAFVYVNSFHARYIGETKYASNMFSSIRKKTFLFEEFLWKYTSTEWLLLSPRGMVISANAEAPIWPPYRMPPNRQIQDDGRLHLPEKGG